jgi:hypothetical protein
MRPREGPLQALLAELRRRHGGRRAGGHGERRGDLPGAEPCPGPGRSRRPPSSACRFVLVGLANRVGPDGTGAFPSVATLVRYTSGPNAPCGPAWTGSQLRASSRHATRTSSRSRIKRADRRPQGLGPEPEPGPRRLRPALRGRSQTARPKEKAAGTRETHNKWRPTAGSLKAHGRYMKGRREVYLKSRKGQAGWLHGSRETAKPLPRGAAMPDRHACSAPASNCPDVPETAGPGGYGSTATTTAS